MPSAIATATILRATRHTPWRELLFVSASIVALTAAPPRAHAADECGPAAATVTCPIDTTGPDYPAGITYSPAADLTLNLDDGVIINGAAGVTVTNSAGAGT